MKDIIVIVGPTGVGKTKLSIELAKKLNAEIINGDSVAVYKNLDIGSAKPSIEERENIPHHLLDICEVEEEYSVFDYQQDLRKLIDEITSRGKRIIIVGGTGLYIESLVNGITFTEQNSDKTVRANLEKQLERAYFPRLKPGSRIWHKNLMGEIMGVISNFPGEENKPLDSTYLMGYYLQRAALYTKNSDNKTEEDENG